MKELQMDISPHFESYMLQRDEKKFGKFNREHTKRQKTLRKKREHEKLRKELDKRFRDVAKNLMYSSMIGCNSDDPKTNNLSSKYVRKPLLSRRGQNVEIFNEDKVQLQTEGPYGDEGYIVQEFHSLPNFDGYFPVLGCWVVAGQPAGLGIRESRQLITTEDGDFVPHVILD